MGRVAQGEGVWVRGLPLPQQFWEVLPEGLRDSSHGHVVARPDGLLARCGGPSLCAVCLAEALHFRQVGEVLVRVCDY